MREFYKTRIPGQILYGTTVMHCPKCRNTKGLSVCGYPGGKARIECPCGADFSPPAPFDATELLKQTMANPTRQTDSMSYGPLPDPRRYA